MGVVPGILPKIQIYLKIILSIFMNNDLSQNYNPGKLNINSEINNRMKVLVQIQVHRCLKSYRDIDRDLIQMRKKKNEMVLRMKQRKI